jgi:hypothetical protein
MGTGHCWHRPGNCSRRPHVCPCCLLDLSLRKTATVNASLPGSNNIGGNASSDGTVTVAACFLTVPNDYRYTYEYRVPRKFFSHDRLDGENRTQYYSDRTPGRSSFTVSIGGDIVSPSVVYGN